MQSKLTFPRSIRYLLAVAEHHSFTRAADALNVTQPTLSQQIKQLEILLDVQLLDRSGRTVRLTCAGEAYLHHARRALDELDAGKRAVTDLEDLSRGSLRLGMTPITEYLTVTLLDDFNARYPGIKVSATEMSQDQIEEGVANNTIDAGIAFTHTTSNESWSRKIEIHTMFIEPLSLAVGEKHALADSRVPTDILTLEREPLILLNSKFALRRHFDLYCHSHGISPRVVIETNSISMIIQSVCLGRVITVLPTTIACTQPGLFAVPLRPELPHHTIALIGPPKDAYKSPACRAFGALASEWNFGRCPASPERKAGNCALTETCKREKRNFKNGVRVPEKSTLAAIK